MTIAIAIVGGLAISSLAIGIFADDGYTSPSGLVLGFLFTIALFVLALVK